MRVDAQGQPLPPLLTIEDVCRIVGCSPATVRRHIRAGRLRAFRPGGVGGYRLDPQELRRWLR